MPSDSPDSQDTPRPIGEIVQGPSAFDQFLDRNQKHLMRLAILIALATAAWVVYVGIDKSKEHTAGADLNKADDLASLQSVIKTHTGTAAASSAEVLLAARQWSKGQQDAAIGTLKTFITAKPKHPARPTAQASLGTMLQSQGKLADAKKTFQGLLEDPAARFLMPYALLSLGDIAKAGEETAQADKFYQKAKTDFPGSSFSKTIDQRIAMLKAKMPDPIDPPAPAPVPSTTVPPAPPATGAGIPALSPPGTLEMDVPTGNKPDTQPGESPAEATPQVPPATPTAPETSAPVQENPAAPRSGQSTQASPPASPPVSPPVSPKP